MSAAPSANRTAAAISSSYAGSAVTAAAAPIRQAQPSAVTTPYPRPLPAALRASAIPTVTMSAVSARFRPGSAPYSQWVSHAARIKTPHHSLQAGGGPAVLARAWLGWAAGNADGEEFGLMGRPVQARIQIEALQQVARQTQAESKSTLQTKVKGRSGNLLLRHRALSQGGTGGVDERFHVAQVALQSAPPLGGQAILGARTAIGKGLRAAHVAGILQLARMHAQIAVGGFEQCLKRSEEHTSEL